MSNHIIPTLADTIAVGAESATFALALTSGRYALISSVPVFVAQGNAPVADDESLYWPADLPLAIDATYGARIAVAAAGERDRGVASLGTVIG